MKRFLAVLILLALAAGIRLTPVSFSSLNRDTIHVTVRGAVSREGEYEIPLYSSVQDVLDLSGVCDSADLSVINPASVLKDHDLIIIPEQSGPEETERISINTADAEELCTLKGIGPATAERIIQWREENGLFQTLEDLMRVKGIGQNTFEKIMDFISL